MPRLRGRLRGEQLRSRRRARAGYWRAYRRRKEIDVCHCDAWWFPHRPGSCEARLRAIAEMQARHYEDA